MRKISVRKNFGGNIFGGKNFGDFLPNFGVIFGERPKNFGGNNFGEKFSVEKILVTFYPVFDWNSVKLRRILI